ncbi:HAD-IC family P-type ATPase [Candidatus Peregrinibacteria bacterium]|nr:HAD-IC family P-type ATPase [Candidatus Peregrinibacteria bacterium]
MEHQNQNDHFFHAKPAEKVLKELGSKPSGLASAEAKTRLAQYGPNEIQAQEKKNAFFLFLKQFASAMIYVLFAAAAISYALGNLVDVYVILAIIVLNAIIGFIQEYRAEKAIEALKKMIVSVAKVFRNGELHQVPARELVPGDIIFLEEGDRFPADARLLECHNFRAVESSLTGESMPIDKTIKPFPEKTGLADRANMVFMGTFAAAGHAKAIVTGTGAETAIGRIAVSIKGIKEAKSHFAQKVEKLTFHMGIMAATGATLTFLVGYFIRGFAFTEIFLFTIATLVAGIPEGLPAILAIVLSVGAHRMAKRNAVIRSLPATETLGVVDVILTDETGTLTENTMMAEKIALPREETISITGKGWKPDGEFLQNKKSFVPLDNPRLSRLLHIAALCNAARIIKEENNEDYQVIGDPTEAALVVLADKAGLKKDMLLASEKLLDDMPFNPELKYRASLSVLIEKHSKDKEIFVVGAPEAILMRTDSILLPSGEAKMTAEDKKEMEAEVNKLAKNAMRVIGIAYKNVSAGTDALNEKLVDGLTLVGVVGMMDPPRAEAAEAVAKAKAAGIRVIMATGDHKETAIAIAKRIGILPKTHAGKCHEALTEAELEKFSPAKFDEAVRHTRVFARLTPKMKLKIAETLQKHGHIVAMTGDGVNDAPALKKADIGIAMGIIGTDVARESSSMVLADDNFASIVNAVEEGRIVFTNTRQSSIFLLSTNFAEAATIILTLLLGYPLPLLATQVLWMNLVTDAAPALALAAEPGHGDTLKNKPRNKNEEILNREALPFVLLIVLVMATASLSVFHFFLPFGLEKARAAVFIVMCFTQFFNALNMQSLRQSVFLTGVSRNMILAIFFSALLTLFVIYAPFFHELFHFAPLNASELIIPIAFSASVLLLGEIYKAFRNFKHI